MLTNGVTRSLATLTTLALVPGLTTLTLAATQAQAAPLPDAYAATAHGDLLDVGATVATADSLTDVRIGHSRSSPVRTMSRTACASPAVPARTAAEAPTPQPHPVRLYKWAHGARSVHPRNFCSTRERASASAGARSSS